MPIEVYDGKIDFADARYQLANVKLVLARFEGVEPGDKTTKTALAKEEGLLSGDPGELNVVEKLLIQPVFNAILGFRGDGSQAAGLLGKRLELPTGDRGLVILASQTSDYLVKRDSEYPTSALLATAFQNGATFDGIENRLKRSMGGIASLFSKIPGVQGEKVDIENETNEAIVKLKAEYGNSEREVIANKPTFESKLVARIEDYLNSKPQLAGEIRQDIADMDILADSSLHQALANARDRLDKIVNTDPQRFDVLPAISQLGAYFVSDKAKHTVVPFSFPEERKDVLDFIVAAASGLQTLDFGALVSGDEEMKDQISRRVKVLRGILSIIQSPEDLVKTATARRNEVNAIKRAQLKDEPPYYDQRPVAVAAVISFLKEQGKEGIDDNTKLGETFAAAWAIVQEPKQMMGEARDQAEYMLEGLSAKKDSPRLLKAELWKDEVALGLLGLVKPTLPDSVVVVPETTKRILERVVSDIPDFWRVNSSATIMLNDIFLGERLPKGTTLEEEYDIFSLLVRANIPSVQS